MDLLIFIKVNIYSNNKNNWSKNKLKTYNNLVSLIKIKIKLSKYLINNNKILIFKSDRLPKAKNYKHLVKILTNKNNFKINKNL
jgi:hypothetical protein